MDAFRIPIVCTSHPHRLPTLQVVSAESKRHRPRIRFGIVFPNTTPVNMQTHQNGIVKQKGSEVLSPPPRTGHFSIYAQKLSAQAFIWLASVTVWGNVVNYSSIREKCNVHCGFQIAFGVLIWILVSAILFINYLAETSSKYRGSFTHAHEVQATGALIFLWVPVVISVSIYNAAPLVATWFAWLGFLASFYATYKAYHSFKEEDLPSDLPDGFDEEQYVYG